MTPAATPRRPPLRHHRWEPALKVLTVGAEASCVCGAKARRTTPGTVKVLVGDAWVLQEQAPSSRCTR